MAVPDIPPGFDFTDPEIYTTRVPAEELAELRRAAPVWWVAQRRGSAGFDDEGYWAVTRHADIMAVSKAPEVYSSWENTALIRFAGGHAARGHRDAAVHPAQHRPARAHQAARHRLPRLHPPGHRQPAPGPDRARRAHRGRPPWTSGTGDFVADVASELPLQAISELLGVPQEDRGKIFSWSNRMIGYDERAAGRRRRDDRGHRDPRLQPGHGRGAARRARATTSSPS